MIEYRGTCIRIFFEANQLSSGLVRIQLADGYTYERINIVYSENVNEVAPSVQITNVKGLPITFPVVNSKSPSILVLYIPDLSKKAEIRILIEKFGQIPDDHYFDKAFEPILVTGDDGNEYNVIPSDQFK